MGILNSITNAVDKHIVKPGNKLLRTALAVAAISTPIGAAQAKTHQEVNAVVITGGTSLPSNPNTPGGTIRTYGVNFEYDDADPKNTAVFGKNLLAEKALGQQGVMAMKGGQAMIMDNSLIQQEPAKKGDTFGKGINIEGLHIYNFNNTLPSSPTTPLNQSSAVLKAEDGFDKMFEENGVRADLSKGLFTTYEMQSGPNGTIVGANVLTTTDLSSDPDVTSPTGYILGQHGDYIVSGDNDKGMLILYKKDAQGKINILSKRKLPDQVVPSGGILPGGNGFIISLQSLEAGGGSMAIAVDDNKTDLATTTTYPDFVAAITTIGANNELNLYTNVDEGAFHITDGKGGDIALKSMDGSPRGDFFHSENDPNTYFRLTTKGVYGFQIKSMNPLTVEEFNIAGPDLTAEFLQGHHTVLVDSRGDIKDKDGIHLGDNCVDIANPSQSDLNKNGLGDACDPNPSSVEFGLVDILPVTQYRLLRNPNKPGKTLVNPQGDGDNVSFELDKGSTDKIWFLPQENSKNGVSFTLPAGYSGDISVIDGGVLDSSGNPITGTITASTSAQTFTLSSAAANVQLVINNDGLSTQGDTTAPDAGSSDTDAGTAEQDAGSTGSDGGTGSDTASADTGTDAGSNPDNGNNGSDTGTAKPDTAGKDTASADTGATISSGDKPGADGCTTAPTSSSNAARTTGAVMGLAALAIALRRKEEENKKKEA